MPDWTKSMQQSFEYYRVDPKTWKDKEKLNHISSCSITRDLSSETLGSASFDVTELMDECYVREYLITRQNGFMEKFPLGTHLVQTSSYSFNGKYKKMSLDGYTPLIELKEKYPTIGYTIPKGENVIETTCSIMSENMRGPVIKPNSLSESVLQKDFTANVDDTWMTFLSDFVQNSKYSLGLDESCRVIFRPNRSISATQPIWEFNDDNSSILCSDIDYESDIYGIPNVIELFYDSDDSRSESIHVVVKNDDPDSILSIPSRGREIIQRITNPEVPGTPSKEYLEEYARYLLKNSSTVECTITYTHGYCPVNVGDCIRLDYKRSGLTDITARVISQTINCETGCQVEETAAFTKSLWNGG